MRPIILMLSACLLMGAGPAAPTVLEGVRLDGKPVSVDLAGKVTVVDMFATWCKPCRAALADYPTLAARFGDRVRLVVVDVEEPPQTVKAYFAQHPLPSEVTLLLDPKGKLASSLEAGSFPTFYLFDRSGVLSQVQRGWGEGSAATLAERISRLVESQRDGGR